MPSVRMAELPENVLRTLPVPARETYQKAYDAAWQVYAKADNRDRKISLEEAAHRVALASLEADFHRSEHGQWVPD
ncbi:ChaB family protein [Gilvimarinus sp. F26214L]|uniref:ChaB family protein n=1 Tax=Gilvimarinus sp. DZF01 TaxID=3461371 RepID=UPI004045D492